MKIAVRADAGTLLGSGHVMRTLTLAEALRRRGAAVTFIMRRRDNGMHEYVASRGFDIVPLDETPGAPDAWLGATAESEFTQARQALGHLSLLDLVIIDHYSLDAQWEQIARAYSRRIMVIDDLANRSHDCDLLLDQNFGSSFERYAKLVPGEATLLIGPTYALLRDEFRGLARPARPRTGEIGRVLVFMGGFDASGETVKALDALAQLAQEFQVDVVLSAQSPHAPDVQRICNDHGYAFLGQVDEISRYMDAADFSIGGMGSAAWERCIAGLPAVTVTLASNQRRSAAACHHAGAVQWLGDASVVDAGAIATALRAFVADAGAVRAMSAAARSVIDASEEFTTDRVVAAVEKVCHA